MPSSTVGLRVIIKRYTKQALETAKALGFDFTEDDLQYFVRMVQTNRAVTIRRESKATTIFLVYKDNKRCYLAYSAKYKLITRFLDEAEARYNRDEPVLVRMNEQWVPGKIVYVLSSYASPKSAIGRLRRYDTSELEEYVTLRPQYSYLVAVKNGGNQEKVIWPPVSQLRKFETVKE